MVSEEKLQKVPLIWSKLPFFFPYLHSTHAQKFTEEKISSRESESSFQVEISSLPKMTQHKAQTERHIEVSVPKDKYYLHDYAEPMIYQLLQNGKFHARLP